MHRRVLRFRKSRRDIARDGLRGVRIGEAAHPGPPKRSRRRVVVSSDEELLVKGWMTKEFLTVPSPK